VTNSCHCQDFSVTEDLLLPYVLKISGGCKEYCRIEIGIQMKISYKGSLSPAAGSDWHHRTFVPRRNKNFFIKIDRLYRNM
jgi:hypothetical protein